MIRCPACKTIMVSKKMFNEVKRTTAKLECHVCGATYTMTLDEVSPPVRPAAHKADEIYI